MTGAATSRDSGMQVMEPPGDPRGGQPVRSSGCAFAAVQRMHARRASRAMHRLRFGCKGGGGATPARMGLGASACTGLFCVPANKTWSGRIWQS